MSCPACEVWQKCISMLEARLTTQDAQIQQLTEKLLALSGDAAERYHRVRMSEIAHATPTLDSAMVPFAQRSAGTGDDTAEELAAEAIYAQIMQSHT